MELHTHTHTHTHTHKLCPVLTNTWPCQVFSQAHYDLNLIEINLRQWGEGEEIER